MRVFKWMNESKAIEGPGRITLMAAEKSDFFRNPGAVGEDGITPESLSNAPFYYLEVAGDFVMKVKVSLDFKDVYDAAAIMVMENEQVWAKACFELTDFNTHAVVSEQLRTFVPGSKIFIVLAVQSCYTFANQNREGGRYGKTRSITRFLISFR